MKQAKKTRGTSSNELQYVEQGNLALDLALTRDYMWESKNYGQDLIFEVDISGLHEIRINASSPPATVAAVVTK